MALRFVIGRAGSGKTHFLHQRLIQHLLTDPLQNRVVLVVPKQATFTAQRRVATDPQLGGYTSVRVIAPDDLAEMALIETGEAAGAKLDPVGRGLILNHLLRTHAGALTYFGRSATQPGLAAEIDRTFSEFERAGRDLCEVDDLVHAASAETDTANLANKLTDLCRLYKLYQQYLKDHDFDAYRRQTLGPEAVEKCPFVQGALVLVDDFFDFTAYERTILLSLARASSEMLISLTFDAHSPLLRDPHLLPTDLDLFHRTELTYRKLYFHFTSNKVPVHPPVLLESPRRFALLALAAIEGNFDARRPVQAVDAQRSVRFIVAADPVAEVDAAARQVKAHLSAGLRMRDICVLARQIDDVEPLINASFTEHGIAYFVDKRRRATHHPLTRTIAAINQIVATRWGNEAVIELARAGLSHLAAPNVDLLDDYLRQHHIPPAAWRQEGPWRFHRSNDAGGGAASHFTTEEIARVNRSRNYLRETLGRVGEIDWAESAIPLRQRMADLFDVMARLESRSKIGELIKQAEAAHLIQDVEEHEQVWARVVELADQLVDLLGDVTTTGAEFASLLAGVLTELDLAITPPTLDQVLVGSVERTRTGDVKAVIVLGLNNGQFPSAAAERSILNDSDRLSLQDSGIEVEATTRQAVLAERFLGYRALTRASHHLTLIRTAADASSNAVEPSPFWQLAMASVESPVVESTCEAIPCIGTPRQAVSFTLQWARRQRGVVERDDAAALYQWLMTRASGKVAAERDRAWPVLSYDNAPVLSPDVAARLYGNRLEASVSRFESFAACPFQHYARYALRLQQPPDPDITAMDLGSLYHTVLERLVKRVIDANIDFATAEDLTAAQIRTIAQRVGEELRNQVFLSSARNRYTLERLELIVHRLIRSQQFLADRGVFRPGYTELTFGKNGTLPPLELSTPAGHTISISGKIDRVDIEPSTLRFTVIDYKLAGDQLQLSHVAHGLMLQLLTYLLVLEAHGKQLAGAPLTPAAALYVKMLRSIDSTKTPDEAPPPEEDAFLAKVKPRGLISAGAADELDREV
ncbi:MAG TPA: PD-(D/E)XK nuclease family protein, partial [Tepidisphaeraceae bacterium]